MPKLRRSHDVAPVFGPRYIDFGRCFHASLWPVVRNGNGGFTLINKSPDASLKTLEHSALVAPNNLLFHGPPS